MGIYIFHLFFGSYSYFILIYLYIIISRLLTNPLGATWRTLVEDHCSRQWNSGAWPKSKLIHIAPYHVQFPTCILIKTCLPSFSLCTISSNLLRIPFRTSASYHTFCTGKHRFEASVHEMTLVLHCTRSLFLSFVPVQEWLLVQRHVMTSEMR